LFFGLEGILVQAEDITQSGNDPSLGIPFVDTPNSYLAELDIFHQIHCLNTLRKHIHYKDYWSGPISTDEEGHRDHYLHTLLQNLMCKADMGIVPINWMFNATQGTFRPKEDFSVIKKCTDFEALLEWATENAIPDFHRVWQRLEYPPGAKTAPDDLY
jgi:Mycotoxin biosynthesis protein UstYa